MRLGQTRAGMRQVVEALDNFKEGSPVSWLVGEPCFGPPPELGRALAQEAVESAFPYSPAAGLRELRQLLGTPTHSGAHGASAEMLTITHGAKSALLLVLGELIGAGDELVTPVPCFPSYASQVEASGGTLVTVPDAEVCEVGLVTALEARLSTRTRAMLIATPSNPSGACLSESDAGDLVALCRERSIVLICDEVYEGFRYRDGFPATAAIFDPQRQVVVQLRSVSKSYALCGWRIGWVISSPALARALAARQSALVNPPATPTQRALLQLDAIAPEYRDRVRTMVVERVRDVVTVFQGCEVRCGMPDGGFYVWVDLRRYLARGGWHSSLEWCREVAAEHGIGLWPGEDFQASGWVRIAVVAPPARLWSQSIERLSEVIRRVHPRRRS